MTSGRVCRHPDKAGAMPESDEKMKEINVAFARLSVAAEDESSDDDCEDFFRDMGDHVGMPPEVFMAL